MISNNDTNLNLSFHPPNPCLLLLPRSLMLSPSPFTPPSPYPYASIYIQLPHTDTDFFRFYRKTLANKKVFSCDLNWDSVGTFLRMAGREFHPVPWPLLHVSLNAELLHLPGWIAWPCSILFVELHNFHSLDLENTYSVEQLKTGLGFLFFSFLFFFLLLLCFFSPLF